MHVTLKVVEKMDNLLDEADELIKCANAHTDDNDLKSIYIDLARCHLDGYERLSNAAQRSIERKAAAQGEKGQAIKEMAHWHMDKFEKRAKEIKEKLNKAV